MIFKEGTVRLRRLHTSLYETRQPLLLVKLSFKETGIEYFSLSESPALETVLKLLMEAWCEFEILPDELILDDQQLLGHQARTSLESLMNFFGTCVSCSEDQLDEDFEYEYELLETCQDPHRILARMNLTYKYHRDLFRIESGSPAAL